MIDSICIITLPGYPHSEAFREIAEGIQGGFQDCGRELLFSKVPMEQGLVFGGNIIPVGIPSSCTIFNLENLGTRWATPAYLTCLRKHTTWDYSEDNIEYLKQAGIEAKYCGIGYHECLTRIEPQEEDIDVLFYGSIFGRRIPILKSIEATGLNCKWLFNCYGKERDHYIARAKTVLNLHAYDGAPFELARCSYLYANAKCVVSEHETRAEDLPTRLRVLVGDHDLRRRMATDQAEAFRKTRQADYLKSLI